MFGLDYGEILVIAIVALVVIGPKDLPRVLRSVGQWVGKGRAMARHFRTGVDAMIREAELDEMHKQWAAQNAQIMAQYPQDETGAVNAEATADAALPPPPAHGGAASDEERQALFGEHADHFTAPGGAIPEAPAPETPASETPPKPAA